MGNSGQKKMKIATVCSGIGSPEQALKELDIPHEISFACEIDKYARQTYLANFTPNQMYTDLTAEEWDKPEQYSDLFIGGIPCQAFSLAGKRLGELDKRGLLFYDFYRYVKNQQPKVFIIENVKGLLSDNNGITFQNWCALLGRSMNTHINMFNHEDSLLYNLHFKVLNSKDFGVPQNRERVFLVGVRNDLPNTFRFPIGERLTKRLKDILEPEVDEKYYLSEKMLELLTKEKKGNVEIANINKGGQKGSVASEDGPYIGCLSATDYKLPKLVEVADNYINESIIKIGQTSTENSQAGKVYDSKGISPTICSGTHGYAMGYIQEPYCVAMRGRNPENPSDRTTGSPMEQRLEPNSQGITNTITSVQKDNLIVEFEIADYRADEGLRIRANGLSPCINSSIREAEWDPKIGTRNAPITSNGHRIRRLTPLECMRLQGYPDSFIKPCSDSQTYKQAGNSITVNVMKAIIKNIIPIL
jgi:DNA (cytosine-5)-methyltransferase 1